MKKIKSAVAILLLPMCFLWGGCQNTSEPAMPQDFIGESPKGERLLEKESVQNLKQVCLLGAYLKRRVNLALICDKKTTVPADELAHCIRESLTYLTQYGAACSLHQEGKGSVSSRDVQAAYDFFEDCLEAALPSLSALMVRVECGERLSIRLMMEDAAGLPNTDKYGTLGQLIIDDADGELCATLSLNQGGERA